MKFALSLPSVCACSSALSFLLVSPAPAQRAPIRLGTGPGTTLVQHELAASGTAVYAAFTDSRHGSPDVFFQRSLDRGATWLAADLRINTTPPGTADAADMQIAASGDAVYLVWTDTRAGARDVFFNRSLDQGSTWLPGEVRLDTDLPGAAASTSAQLAVRGSELHVVWSDARNGEKDIYYTRSTDGGATWLATDLRLDTDGAGLAASIDPLLKVSGNHVYVLWHDARGPSHFQSSADAGRSWLASDVALGRGRAHALCAQGSEVYVAYAFGFGEVPGPHFPNPGIAIERSLDGGRTWLPSPSILTSHPSCTQSIVAEVSGRSVTVAWAVLPCQPAGASGAVQLINSQDGGQTWPAGPTTMPGFAYLLWGPELVFEGSKWFVSHAYDCCGVWSTVACSYSVDDGITWITERVADDYTETRLAIADSSVYLGFQREAASSYGPVDGAWLYKPFGVQAYGSGLAGAGGVTPSLDASGWALIGSTLHLELSAGVGDAPGALLFGATPASQITLPFLGGTLLVAPDLVVPLGLGGSSGVPGVGNASLAIPIPGDPSLRHQNLNVQAVLLDGAAPSQVSLTKGLELWIG